MSKIRAVIFDMDGVLIDAKDWHYEAFNRALRLFGFEISRYDHIITYDGLPTRKKLEMLSLEQNLPEKLHDFINEMKQLYTMEIVHARCKPIFQHEYALSNLKSKGYKLGLASNSIRESIKVMLSKSNLLDYMDTVVSAEDVVYPKPDPEIYIKAMKQLDLSPDECLIVEDNENGIKSAKASGGNLFIVEDVMDVSFDNITKLIDKIESGAL